jgi:hypothetical protein
MRLYLTPDPNILWFQKLPFAEALTPFSGQVAHHMAQSHSVNVGTGKMPSEWPTPPVQLHRTIQRVLRRPFETRLPQRES